MAGEGRRGDGEERTKGGRELSESHMITGHSATARRLRIG